MLAEMGANISHTHRSTMCSLKKKASGVFPLPFPRYNLTLKIQGQRSMSKVKVKGTLVNVASSWLISFYFTSIGPTIPKMWQIECSTGENGFNILQKI